MSGNRKENSAAAEHIYFGRKIIPIARDIMKLAIKNTISVADIGCYKRPVASFVSKNFPNSRFMGVDEDPDALAWLRKHGLNGCNFAQYSDGEAFDFSFLLEVVEHIPEEFNDEFLRAVFRQTNVAAFFTTPNFFGWDAGERTELKLRAETSELRYAPDHLKNFKPFSSNPHDHKRIMTVDWLSQDIENTLPDGWRFRVFKAWPWTLTDHSTGAVFNHCFKVYAVAWKEVAFPEKLVDHVLSEHLSSWP